MMVEWEELGSIVQVQAPVRINRNFPKKKKKKDLDLGLTQKPNGLEFSVLNSVFDRAVSKPSVPLVPHVVLRQCCCTTSAWRLLLVPVLAWPFPSLASDCRRQGRAGWDTDYSNMLSSQLQLSLSCSPRSQLSHSELSSV